MKCSRALLIARLLLVLSLVRGLHGVDVLGRVLLSSAAALRGLATAGSVTKQTWSDLLDGMLEEARDSDKEEADLTHAEGLSGGLSGAKPLRLLARLADARTAFHNASLQWATVVDKCLGRGYKLTSQDVVKMRDAVAGEVFLAKHKNGLKKADGYTAMSLARTAALLLPVLLDRGVEEYDEELQGKT